MSSIEGHSTPYGSFTFPYYEGLFITIIPLTEKRYEVTYNIAGSPCIDGIHFLHLDPERYKILHADNIPVTLGTPAKERQPPQAPKKPIKPMPCMARVQQQSSPKPPRSPIQHDYRKRAPWWRDIMVPCDNCDAIGEVGPSCGHKVHVLCHQCYTEHEESKRFYCASCHDEVEMTSKTDMLYEENKKQFGFNIDVTFSQ